MSIDIQHISKRFGTFTALSDVTLQVPDGQLVALLGPSGSGKTTLLRVIAGLEFPDAGRVHLAGQDVTHAGPGERGIGFVFQHYALFKHMSVFENVAFGLHVKRGAARLPKAVVREKVMHLLRLVQLDWAATRYPAQLSGGQRQRVALARALAVEPRVLLLDEPFGALDAAVRQELRDWLRQLHDEIHLTSVFVTHDQAEAMEIADRIVVFNQGRIEQEGPPESVYDHPATPFTYRFLGKANVLRETEREQTLVRPHDLTVSTQGREGSLPAQVTRIHIVGPEARVEVRRTDLPGTLEIHAPKGHLQGIEVGQRVHVTAHWEKTFPKP
ncbi:sulfate/molybdate ABC transporter ATP-binding protein [Deinococcus hopiensis]|uniref:Sulfate transport system ATP-binding protein n=1 Tax=Deinococcus hopiensis KR-140 TaxID=695939 RepID=A0A1W1UQ83_9DEIO|nr:sulfate ABC transporter ATP-binding protein [Deinococcus hopiensis]SMB83257.1 sulfate transport system ATP-binding protein [Deinococcus hopiensis KR-140]